MRNMRLPPRTALALQALLLIGLALIAAIAAADRPTPTGAMRGAGAAPGITTSPGTPAAPPSGPVWGDVGASVGGAIRA